MNNYMVEIELPAFMGPDFMELIPKQREYVNTMFDKGTITGYSLTADRSKLWVSVAADSMAEVDGIIRKFPILRYITYNIHELMLHESAMVLIPSISLN
ncbi:MAG: hypothetical protein U0V74_16660 [Chitinophagales bacterium]